MRRGDLGWIPPSLTNLTGHFAKDNSLALIFSTSTRGARLPLPVVELSVSLLYGISADREKNLQLS